MNQKLSATPSKGNAMTGQLNWQKIRTEINRLTDVEQLKSEVQRIGSEIRKFDFQAVLSPAAQQKLKKFEKRYTTLMRSISQAQRQMDREFNRVLRNIKTHRSDVEKAVAQQKTKLEKTASGLRKRFSKKSAGKATPGASRKRGSSKTAKSSRKKA
jgi:predicted  nucleic acid-binding Zn-ribbon protein